MRLDEQVVRHCLVQEFRQAGIQRRGFGESAPHGPPRSFAPAEAVRGNERAILVRVELEIGLAARRKGAPSPGFPAGQRRLGVAEPEEQIPDRIIGEQRIEIVCFETPAFEQPNRRGRELGESAQHGLPSYRVLSHVQTKAAIVGDHERFHRPVPAVLLRPACTSVLKLHQRLQVARTRFRRAECLPTHVGEVEHGRHVAGEPWQFQHSIDYAPQPD